MGNEVKLGVIRAHLPLLIDGSKCSRGGCAGGVCVRVESECESFNQSGVISLFHFTLYHIIDLEVI